MTVSEDQGKKAYISGLARLMMALFPPSPDATGRLSGWALDAEGNKKVGSKQQFTAKVTAKPKDYIYHLCTPQKREPRGIGIYPIDYVNKNVRFIVIDIDEDSPSARNAVMNMAELIKMRGGHPYIEKSTQGRWHLWFFSERPLPMQIAGHVSRALVYVAKGSRVPVESYPASFFPDPLPRSGKYINLPYRGALYGMYNDKETDYDMYGITSLIDPYQSDDDDDFTEGRRIPIHELGEIKLNTYEVTQQLASFGRTIEIQELEKQRKNDERRGRNKVKQKVADGEIDFDDVLEQLKKSPPKIGDRHQCILALCGAALFMGKSQPDAIYDIGTVVPSWQKAGERRDWSGEIKRAVEDTYSKGRGARITGLPTLKRLGIVK